MAIKKKSQRCCNILCNKILHSCDWSYFCCHLSKSYYVYT